MSIDLHQALWTEHDLAAFLRCSLSKLRKDRMAGRGVPYVKNGRLVRYRAADALAFVDGQRIQHNGQAVCHA